MTQSAGQQESPISLISLADRFIDAHNTMPNRAFAFVLGAGASRSSGIKGAGQMVDDWIRLRHREVAGDTDGDYKTWATAQSLGIKHYDPADPAASYSELYRRMYARDPDRGYAYLEEQMRTAEPSFGYSVLARIMETTRHKVVVTTNFDNLVADSLSIFSKTYPLVCGHESLAGFISARARRPLVVKVHHDLLLAPKSAPEDLGALPQTFSNALAEIFRHYTPIVIGYGGNDGSLMQFLKDLPKQSVPGGVYWCYWEDGEIPSGDIRQFVAAQQGDLVPIPGFDETMMLFGDTLEFDIPEKFVLTRAEARAKRIVEQAQALKARLNGKKTRTSVIAAASGVRDTGANPPYSTSEHDKTTLGEKTIENNALAKAVENTMQRTSGALRWWQWEALAKAEADVAERDRIYQEAIAALPNSAALLNNYALFLTEISKNHDKAETYYIQALAADPNNAVTLSNYAYFLETVRKDHDKAETYYTKALAVDPTIASVPRIYADFLTNVRKNHDKAEAYYTQALAADPSDADALSNYAYFLQTVRKDHDKAETYYKKALTANPTNAYVPRIYADFLTNIRKDHDKAEEYYTQAIAADSSNTATLSNYAYFLQHIRKDYDKAEAYLTQAITADPTNTVLLLFYADFLTNIRKDHDKAEDYFTQAIAADPSNTVALNNYAYFLQDIRKDYEKAEDYYTQAIATDSKNTVTLNNYAYFLQYIRKDYDKAEAYLTQYVTTHPTNAILLNLYADFLTNIRKDYDRAESYYMQSIAADPANAAMCGGYAHFLTEVRKDYGQAESLYKKALSSDPPDANFFPKYARFLIRIGRTEEGLAMLEQAIALIETLEPDVMMRAWMYATCHWLPDRWREGLTKLKQLLLVEKITVWEGGLIGVVEAAKKRGHPAAEWLDPLAAVCTGTADASTLDGWDAWREA